MKWLTILAFTFLANATAVSADVANGGLPAPGTVLPAKSTEKGYEVRIAIPPEAGVIGLQVQSVDPALSQFLGPAPQLFRQPSQDAKSAVHFAIIEITTPRLVQSQYPLTLIATTDKGVQAPRDVWLQIPAVSIDPISTLVVRREVLWPWSRLWTLDVSHPQIWETSRHAWLTSVVFQQKGDSTADGLPGGRIEFPQKAPDVPPGGSTSLGTDDLRLEGRFPIGKTTGSIVLQGDQLAAPVTFGFEVTSVLPRFYLLLPLAVGLWLGWLTRNHLHSSISLNQKRQAAITLVAAVDKALAAYVDPAFQAAATKARKAAEPATTDRDPKAIDDAVAEAQKEFKAALDDLQKRQDDLQADLASTLSLVSQKWNVPRDLANGLAEARAALRGIPTDGSVAGAATTIGEVKEAVARQVAKSGENLREMFSAAANDAPALAPVAGVDAASQFARSLNTVAGAVRDAVAAQNLPPSSLDLITKSLQAIHSGESAAAMSLYDLVERMDRALSNWKSRLKDRDLAGPDAWRAAAAKADLAIENLRASETEPTALAAGFLRGAVDAVGDLRAAIAVQAKTGTDLEAKVKAALDQGDLEGAVAALAVGLPASAGSPGVAGAQALEARRSFVADPSAGGTESKKKSRPPSPAIAATPSPQTFGIARASRVVPLDVAAEKVRTTLAISNLVLYLVYASIILLVGYLLYEEKWTGTLTDFATAFFWAYAIDISADAATAAIKGIRGG